MSAEISKLVNEVAAFLKTIENQKSHVEGIVDKLEKNVAILREQLEVASVSRKASVPRNMLKKFPDIKQRLLSNLNTIIQEEIVEITRHVDRLSEFSGELRKINDKMEKLMTQIKWKEHIHFYGPFSRILEWSDKCWKFFHLICANLRNGLTAVLIDDTHSSVHIKFVGTVDGIDRKYVFDDQIDRMFQLLKIDLSSRSKIYVS